MSFPNRLHLLPNILRLFTVQNITWFEAEKFCRGFSVPCGNGGSSGISLGHLASVHSQEEMDLLGALYDSVRSKWVSRNVKVSVNIFKTIFVIYNV